MRRSLISALAGLCLAASIHASPLAIGYQKENWTNVDLDASTNPRWPASKESGFGHLKFDVKDITTWYLEEPGIIFGALAGMTGTEANRINARNEAIRKGELSYTYNYASPPPIPTGRWNRWSYSTGSAVGVSVEDPVTKAMVFDKDLKVDYMRLNMDIVTGPMPFGGQFYWMPSFDLSGRSLRFYKGNTPKGTDFSTFTVPMNLHLGWQPTFFPYLTLEAKAGWDWISWALLSAAAGANGGAVNNYTHGYNYGIMASVGVDWIQAYYRWSKAVDPLWNFDTYARRYEGNQDYLGVRLDLGNIIARLFVKD